MSRPLPAPQRVVLFLRLTRPAVDALARQPDGVDDDHEAQHDPEESEGPRPAEKRRERGGDSDEEDQLERLAPPRRLLLEMSEEEGAESGEGADNRHLEPQRAWVPHR